jgi:hypothetical protein
MTTAFAPRLTVGSASNHEEAMGGVAPELFDQAIFAIEIGLQRFTHRATHKHQLRCFFFAFFPNAGFAGNALAGEALAGGDCPAWTGLFQCRFLFPKSGSLPNPDWLSV